jgi:hypothetical protein
MHIKCMLWFESSNTESTIWYPLGRCSKTPFAALLTCERPAGSSLVSKLYAAGQEAPAVAEAGTLGCWRNMPLNSVCYNESVCHVPAHSPADARECLSAIVQIMLNQHESFPYSEQFRSRGPHPHHLGEAARIVTIGFGGAHGQSCMGMAGVHADHWGPGSP